MVRLQDESAGQYEGENLIPKPNASRSAISGCYMQGDHFCSFVKARVVVP